MKLDEQRFTIPIDRVDFVNAKKAANVLDEVRMPFLIFLELRIYIA